MGTSFKTAISVAVGEGPSVTLGTSVADGRSVGVAGVGIVDVGVFASEQPDMKKIVRMARDRPGQSFILTGDIDDILPGQKLDHKCFTRQMPLK